MARGKSGKKSSLKASLQSQQSRFKQKEKLSHAAAILENRSKGEGKRRDKGKAPQRRPTAFLHPTDKILLIGEGNFSFARALLVEPPAFLQGLPAENITATAYDSEDGCYKKYPEAQGIVASLRQRGVQILFQVDATKLEKISVLRGRRWDRIMWNFPHAGKGISDQDRNILSNQLMILGFLRSAADLLALGPIPVFDKARKRKRSQSDDEDTEDEYAVDDAYQEKKSHRGTVLITLRNVHPYTAWDVPYLAKKSPLPTAAGSTPQPPYKLLRSFVFHRAMWAGYEHRMTKGERAQGEGTTGQGGEDRTWEFCLP